MSYQKYSSGNILTNHSKKIAEFQKNIEEIYLFNNRFESKIKNLVKDFNETIININDMFIEKSINITTNVKHNFDKSILPKNSISHQFGTSVTQNKNNIVFVGDPLNQQNIEENIEENKGCVYVYHKNQYNHYAEQQKIKSPTNFPIKSFGQSITASEQNLAVSAIAIESSLDTKKGYLFIYEKNNDLWSVHQIIELNFPDKIDNIMVKIYNDIIVCHDLHNILMIYERNQDNRFEKIKNIEGVKAFSLYEKSLVYICDNHIIISNSENEWNEIQRLSFSSNISKPIIAMNDNHFAVCLGYNKIEIYGKDSLENWGKSQDIIHKDITGICDNICLDDDTLLISEIKNRSGNDSESIIYIYKLNHNDEWKYLRKINFKNKNNISVDINLLNKNIIFSNIMTDIYNDKSNDKSNTSEVYIINEYEDNIKWRGEYFAYMNKIDLQISGEYFSDNISPHFSLKWDNFKLPPLKDKFYYKNIPNISINIYDLDDNSYRNDLQIYNIEFNQNNLDFSIKNIDTVPYNFVFNIEISYLAN